jgi:dihydroorotase
MGMPLREVLSRGSWYPARAIHRDDLGNLGVGSVADIAILRVREGSFGYIDAKNNLLKGSRKLEAELTIKDGQVVWDLNGLAAQPVR